MGGLGHVIYGGTGLPAAGLGRVRLFLELKDMLGSTSVVLDHRTAEVVEKVSYDVNGSTDADYRPARWAGFREDYRFTGKEEDIEVGLTYFGARYLNTNLRRWISPDPLTIHGGAGDSDPYAYVAGRVLAAVDPFGLDHEVIIRFPDDPLHAQPPPKPPQPPQPPPPESGLDPNVPLSSAIRFAAKVVESNVAIGRSELYHFVTFGAEERGHRPPLFDLPATAGPRGTPEWWAGRVVGDGAGFIAELVTPAALASQAEAKAANGLPTLPRAVGASANITTRSRIAGSTYAVRAAGNLGEQAQRDVDALLSQLRSGNVNPGIGTRSLGNNFFELRGANAGRVIVKQTSAGAFDIVGKFQGHVRGDAANSAIIARLIGDYSGL